MMVLLYAGQSIASAAVSFSMAANSHMTTAVTMAEGKSSCHQEENESNSEASSEVHSEANPEETKHCCDIDCHCPLGLCVSAALPVQSIVGGHQTSFIQKDAYHSQWLISQSPSSLYRPPITL